jgi:prepilin-type N-terminal cleavage/methylation domain-containing protein
VAGGVVFAAPSETDMTPNRPVRRAFTLIELLVVIGIIAVLMGIAIAVGSRVQDSGRVKSTRDMLLALDAINTAAMAANGSQVLPGVVADPRLTANRNDPSASVWVPIADARADYSEKHVINSVGLFLWQAGQYPDVAKLVEALPSRMMKILELDAADVQQPSPSQPVTGAQIGWMPKLVTALDAWGNPIRYVHPSFDGVILGGSGAGPRPVNTFADIERDLGMRPPQSASAAVVGTFLFDEIRRNCSKQAGNVSADRSLGADSDGGTCVGGRPYFYSAGPDGDPSTTEDNVYTTVPTHPKKN